MAYRLTYQVTLSWVSPGTGQLGSPQSPSFGQGFSQALTVINAVGGQNAAGGGTAGAINSTDITNLTNSMASDISTQLNLSANLGKAQGWTTGQP